MLYLIKLNIGNKQYRKCIPQLTLGRKTTTKNLRSFNMILQLNDKRFSFSDGLFFYIFLKMPLKNIRKNIQLFMYVYCKKYNIFIHMCHKVYLENKLLVIPFIY